MSDTTLERTVSASRSGPEPMRIVVVAESFLPLVNGVTNSVLRVIENMTSRGHAVSVIAPATGRAKDIVPEIVSGASVHRVPSLPLPAYGGMRVGYSSREVARIFDEVVPDVVHLAAPTILGSAAINVARSRQIPTVAIYQTDLAGFASRYHLSLASRGIWRHLSTVHSRADVTLAPSTAAVWDLRHRGVDNVKRWMRGVDLEKFNPRHRDEGLRSSWAPSGEVIVGYVGRLAREKQVERLSEISSLPGCRLVIVGDGPYRTALERRVPNAIFTGFQSGHDLSRHYASLDVFVHTGTDETFCQAVQEALAAGVPVVAPAAGGPMDLVQHGVNGYLWSPSSPASLAGAVGEIVGSSIKRGKLAEMARPSVEGRTWASVMDELEGHYRAVTGGLSFAYRGLAA